MRAPERSAHTKPGSRGRHLPGYAQELGLRVGLVDQGQRYSQHEGAGQKRTRSKEAMSVAEHQTALHPVQGSTPPADHGTFDAFFKAISVLLAIAVVVVIWIVDTRQVLSIERHKAVALSGGIFVPYRTEAIPLAIASLLVVPAATLAGTANFKGALEGFSMPSAYLIVGAFILATAMVTPRLAERITYPIHAQIGSAPIRIPLRGTIVNIVLAFLVPSSTARTAILLPERLRVLTLFRDARSKFTVNLLLTLTMTNVTISARILTVTVPNPLTMEFKAKAGGHEISCSEWLGNGFLLALIMTFFTWWFIQVSTNRKSVQLWARSMRSSAPIWPRWDVPLRPRSVCLPCSTLSLCSWAAQARRNAADGNECCH
jgi:hypothetical protein